MPKERYLKITMRENGPSYLIASAPYALETLQYEIDAAEIGDVFCIEVVEEDPSVVDALPEFDGF